jgi:hypothetical protein
MGINERTVEYWRHPTPSEIKFGEGAIHYLSVDISRVLKPDGNLKKWFIHTDGLRYNL